MACAPVIPPRRGNAVACLAALCGWDTRARTASRAAEGLSLAAARVRRVHATVAVMRTVHSWAEAPDMNRAGGTTPQPGSGMPEHIRSPPAKAPGLQALSWLGRVRGAGAASTPQRSGWRSGDRPRRPGKARCRPRQPERGCDWLGFRRVVAGAVLGSEHDGSGPERSGTVGHEALKSPEQPWFTSAAFLLGPHRSLLPTPGSRSTR